MATGFTPKHNENISLDDLTPQQFIALLHEAAKNLDWNVAFISDSGLIAYTNNGMFSWNGKVTIKIENDLATIQSASTGNEMMDWGKNKKNVINFISTLETLKPYATKEDLDIKYQELKEQIVSEEEDILKLPPPTTTQQLKDVFAIFKPTKGFFITPILIDLNILVFIIMVICGVDIMSPTGESLLAWGANFRPVTLEGQWWRLITNCFLHIGIFHLLMNMYALLYIGILLEPYLGKARFLSAYLLTGIIASTTSVCWHDLTISAGASGAIFGMYGVFLAMLTTDFIEKSARKALLASIGIFVGYNLLYGIKGNIDNAAHIGGLLGGIIIGYLFIPSLNKPYQKDWKFGTIAILTLVVLGSCYGVCKEMPNDIAAYQAKMKEFITMESGALEVFNSSSDKPRERLLYDIKERGIYYWNEALQVVEDCQKMNLPASIQAKNKLMHEYCELRIKSYELMYKSIEDSTDQYNGQMIQYNKQIAAKMKELGVQVDTK